ncbi:DUF4397 domain-containing protein [Flavicella marina]|uniref:DUF4397 domain-containing protein n=1 Tax=Flavicella marina TaxID=1475951 RepID=UPI0012648C34|nr:DUF4397 domain-containing protein [Flavicella marina]
MKISITLLTIILLFSFGCSKDSTENPPETIYESARFISHNYINSDIQIDWLQDTKLLWENQSYAFAGNREIEWEENQNKFTIFTNNTNDNTTIASKEMTVFDGNSYSGFLYGVSGSENLLITENNTTTPQTGNVRVQFIHLYQSLGGVDIYVGGESSSDRVVTNLTYGTTSDYYEFLKATIDAKIIITNTGTLPDSNTDLMRIENHDGHAVDKIYIDVLAGINYDANSKLSLFETPQH